MKEKTSYYKSHGCEIPFEVAFAEAVFYDDGEGAWCIDAFPADDMEEGTAAALVYSDGRIRPLYPDALEHPIITQAIGTALASVFR